MKTFTNLIKCASLSTFNKKRYYLFIIMLLTLGIGSAWAENVTVTKTTNTLVSELSWSVSSGSTCAGCYTSFDLNEAISISTTGTPNCGSVWGTTTNDWRLYQNQNGNVTVSAKDGYELVSVKYTYSQSNSGTLKDGSTTIATKTVVDCSGLTTKTLTVGNTETKANGQVRITEFSVTYVQTSGDTPEPDPTPVTVTLDQTTLSLQEGENATLTATVTGSSDPVTWTSSEPTVATVNEGVVTALTAGETTITSAIGEVKATCVVTVTAAPVTPDPGAGSANVTYDFTKIDGFSSWGNSYAKHIVTYSDAKVTFEAASKQTSNVTDCPVTKGKYVTLVMTDGSTLSSVEWVCKQWTTKTQTITLHYSTDGGNTYTSTGVTSTNFTISSNSLPTGTNAVKITFSSTSNQVGISSCTITKVTSDEPQPVIVKTLKSIAVTPTTTTYEQGDVFSFEGTCTATYSVTKDDVAQADETKEVTPTSVSTPDMSTTGNKVVTVSYTEGEVTVETTYTITVTENTITPGTCPGNLNNAFFGCATGNNAEEQSGKLEDILVVSGCTQSASTKTNYQSDHVRYYTDSYLKFSAPTGYVLTAIQFTAYTGSAKWDGEITATVGTYDADGKSWTGSAQEVQFNFGKQNRIASVSVTYAEASKYALTITTPSNGTLTVKEGENAVATGDKFYAGTQLTITATPEEGYKLASVSVVDGSSTDVTASVYDNGTLTMPEYDVTISATFEAAKTLTSIDITTAATQTTFWQGETFNSTGLVVTAHFDGAADEVVTPTVTGSTATAGTQTVTVSFTEGTVTKSTTYNITVKAIPNTKETAYSVADAYDIIDKLTTAEGVFISGIISQVDSYNSTYKSITYWISADGTTTNQLQAYSGKGLESADFAEVTDLTVGDQVIVCGNLKKYSGTYEFDKNNYLASHTPTTKDPAGLVYATTEYTANVGEAFATPTLTNPNNLTVTYSTSDASKATVDASTGAVTIVAVGKVTITASTTGDATHDAGTASYTITISDPALAIATLPFTYNSGKAAIETTAGITQSGLGSDYTAAGVPPLKFDTEGDNVIVHYDQQAGEFSFVLKQNGQNAGTFTVYESANGEDYTPVWTGGELGNAQSETITPTLAAASRYVKFEYTTKGNSTNYGLGSISIQKPDLRQEAGIAWSAETTTITIGDAFTAPTLSNPNGLTLTCTSDNDALATVTNAGVITLKEGVTGKAVITATFTANENYKGAEVTTTIYVNPKTDDVVILAKYNGQWYAMMAEYVTDKTDRLAALPVNYVGGKLYNVSEEDKAAITWKLSVNGGNATFQNGTNYLTGGTSTTLSLNETAFDWAFDGSLYLSDSDSRTFIYHKDGYFRNYAKGNPENYPDTYSTLPVVTAPVFADGDAYGRSVNLGEDDYRYGTICLPFGSTNFTGAEFFECVGKEEGKVFIGSVTELEAGVPYIFLASATEVAVYGNGTTAATAGNSNGLYGTFDNDTEVAVGNYILLNNELCQAEAICYVNANRAYLVMSEVPEGAPTKMPGRRYIGMDVEGENEATGFDNIQLPNANSQKLIINGQLIIIRDGEMYNAQGQRL